MWLVGAGSDGRHGVVTRRSCGAGLRMGWTETKVPLEGKMRKREKSPRGKRLEQVPTEQPLCTGQ